MARPVAILCLLTILAGATVSEKPDLDWLRRLASQPQPERWDPSILVDLNPDSRFTYPESRYRPRYTAPFDNQQVPNENQPIATPTEGSIIMTDDTFSGMPTPSGADRNIESSELIILETLSNDEGYADTREDRILGMPKKRLNQDETDDEYKKGLSEETYREPSEKRSAVATALNAGRRRRQPAPALGKAFTPYVGVGVLNDVGSFFDSLRDNLQTLASLSPSERASLLQDPPTVVHAPARGGSGGGVGFRKLKALRPLRPTGYIRSYNRRSMGKKEDIYKGANRHDPALLWTGLGR